MTSDLASALVRHDYTTHVRELLYLLLRSAATSRGADLELTKDVRALVRVASRAPAAEVTAEQIRAASSATAA